MSLSDLNYPNINGYPVTLLDQDIKQLSASDTIVLTGHDDYLKDDCQLHHRLVQKSRRKTCPLPPAGSVENQMKKTKKKNDNRQNDVIGQTQKSAKKRSPPPLYHSYTGIEVCSSCSAYLTPKYHHHQYPIPVDRRMQVLGLNSFPNNQVGGRNQQYNQDSCLMKMPSSNHYNHRPYQINESLAQTYNQEKQTLAHFSTIPSIAGNETHHASLRSPSIASTFPMGSQTILPPDQTGFKNNSYYDSQFSLTGSQCCQHCQINLDNSGKASCRWQSQNVVFPNESHGIPVDDSSIGLTWRRLHMSRAKLKATATTSELLSGFAMVAMVELQINEPTNVPEWLFIMFSVCTTVLVAVHIFALMISTYLLPNIDAISKMQCTKMVEESPHERMKGFVEVAWAFSTVLGLFLFLVEVAILCWVKFWDFSIRAAMAATIIVIPVLIVFIVFVFHFYRSLMFYKCESSTTDINELEKIRKKLDGSSHV